ncbi:MAG TPA: aromatic ring-hydroxylating dioxygenase subunit alpha [Candidatus Dormibacteraeota bacterium]|nr:aromatic ring-hydroxylating dioxygenase subunit alpha [Candidatus Dormibacteraeota bacterium]
MGDGLHSGRSSFAASRPAPLTPDEIAALRRPFREATLLPARVYTSDDVWAWEREAWFLRDWLCVARAEEAPEPGTFVTLEVVGQPVLLVRGGDGGLRAFHNVCRHRGTLIAEEASGRAVRFQCPYHAWVYDLEGRLVRAKHMDDVAGFSTEAFGLAPIRCATWGGFVFVSFAPDGPPLDEWLDDWVGHHAAFGRDLSRLRRVERLEYEVAANWKIVAENYSECYHCPGGHPLLNRLTPYDLGEDFFPAGPWKGGWMPFADGCETMSMDGLRHDRPLLYARDEVEAGRIYYYVLWPNLIVSIHPDYVLTHRAWPEAAGRTRVVCDLYVDQADADAVDVSGALDFWDLTNRQDYHVVELQQRGMASSSWVAGRYSNQEASVHAFDLMVADRYADDGVRSERGARAEPIASGPRRRGR